MWKNVETNQFITSYIFKEKFAKKNYSDMDFEMLSE